MALPVIMAALMAAKGIKDSADKRKANLAQSKADKVALQMAPYSGLNVSHLAGKDYSSGSDLSGALQGGISGYTAGNNIGNAMVESEYTKNLSDYLKRGMSNSPYSKIMGSTNDQDTLDEIRNNLIGMKGFGNL